MKKARIKASELPELKRLADKVEEEYCLYSDSRIVSAAVSITEEIYIKYCK